MNTIRDVELVLASKKNNLTSRRWLNDQAAKECILEMHNAWNSDHIIIGQPEALLTLEESINSYLHNPSLIDNEKERP